MLFPEFQKRRRQLSTRVGYAKAALALSGGVANESIYLYADRFIVKPLVAMGKHLVVTGNEETVWKSLLAAEWHLFTCAINDGMADFEAGRMAKRFARNLREERSAPKIMKRFECGTRLRSTGIQPSAFVLRMIFATQIW